MSDYSYSIRPADWRHDAEGLREVRRRVFVEEQKVPLDLEWDGMDEDAVHLLAEDAAGHPIGTARLLADGHIGRMAVLPAQRGVGVGSALLSKLLDLLRRRGQARAFLNAQTSALGFYRRFGFVTEGAEFMDAGIPHRRMVLALSDRERRP